MNYTYKSMRKHDRFSIHRLMENDRIKHLLHELGRFISCTDEFWQIIVYFILEFTKISYYLIAPVMSKRVASWNLCLFWKIYAFSLSDFFAEIAWQKMKVFQQNFNKSMLFVQTHKRSVLFCFESFINLIISNNLIHKMSFHSLAFIYKDIKEHHLLFASKFMS